MGVMGDAPMRTDTEAGPPATYWAAPHQARFVEISWKWEGLALEMSP